MPVLEKLGLAYRNEEKSYKLSEYSKRIFSDIHKMFPPGSILNFEIPKKSGQFSVPNKTSEFDLVYFGVASRPPCSKPRPGLKKIMAS